MRGRSKIFCAVCAMALLHVSCSQRRVSWDADSSGAAASESYAGAEREITDLDKEDWRSPADYVSLREVKIGAATSLGETDRLSLEEGLDKAYAAQLVRTQGHILDSDCAPRHATLYAARREYAARLKNFGTFVPAGKETVDAAFRKHEQMMAFSVSGVYNVPISSCLDPYDDFYDIRKRSEAAQIRASAPKCLEIRRRVSEENVSRALAARRQNYYARLVDKFCAEPAPGAAAYNRLTDVLGNASGVAALKARVEAHWVRSRRADISETK